MHAALPSSRVDALKQLSELPQVVSYIRLFPYRQQIIKTLLPALDDKKRAVRLQTVLTRNKWMLMR
ncbi:hypothetical protein EON64_11015 [archaeon]|nr:MAG: hypothetical protein EON64_11015 [archaeon]